MTILAAPMRVIARSGSRAVWLRVERVRGSAPREPGAAMLVDARGRVAGTIGGGHLELEAIAQARRMLAAGERVAVRAFTLGVSLGQCCGGEVTLSLRTVDAAELGWIEPLAALERDGGVLWLRTRLAAAAPADDPDAGPEPAAHTVVLRAGPEPAAHTVVLHAELASAAQGVVPHAWPPAVAGAPGDAGPAFLVSRLDVRPWHVWVFGAGHVGDALVRVLATLPATIAWVDPRASQFPAGLPPAVACIEADSPAHEVAAIPAGADVLVMTHSHALDFDLCVALLARRDLGLVGLIGSRTKAARFRARLARRGLPPERIARLQCPIGAPPDDGDTRDALDRHPGAIAVSVAFDLWRRRRDAAGVPATAPAVASTAELRVGAR